MKIVMKAILALALIISMVLTLTACNFRNFSPVADLLETIESIFRSSPGDQPPEPEEPPEPDQPQAPDPPPPPATPEPGPAPVLTPEPSPEVIGNRFPFSFSSVDLQGNFVTEEDLGDKELYVAYLWAVW